MMISWEKANNVCNTTYTLKMYSDYVGVLLVLKCVCICVFFFILKSLANLGTFQINKINGA